jgi:hypothetical protein
MTYFDIGKTERKIGEKNGRKKIIKVLDKQIEGCEEDVPVKL